MPTLPPRPPLRPGRRRLRRPLPYWLLAGALALGTALLVGRLVAAAESERSRWGRLAPTMVTTTDVAGGEPLHPDDVTVRLLPAALVPDGALDRLPDGAVAAVDLHRGEPLLAGRLAGAGASPVAARLPRGTKGVAVPAGDGLPVEVGDHVDVLATFGSGALGDEGDPTFAVARLALVVHVGEHAVTVAVDDVDAARVVYALATGTVALVLSGTSSPPG